MHRLRVPLLLAAVVPLACCAPVGPPPPSLAPRTAEAIDPRLPVSPASSPRPVDPVLATRLAALVRQARAGDDRFRVAAAEADQLARSAGPARSESWVVAQEALSGASAARAETSRALADIDAIAASALQTQGTLAPADLSAIQTAATQAAAIERSQAARISSISTRLGR
ncbi:MAG: hypothetical protein ABIO43_10550 [Sphingomicrobium sp.]